MTPFSAVVTKHPSLDRILVISVLVNGSSSTTKTCMPGSTFTAAVDDSGLPCAKQLSKAVMGDVFMEEPVMEVLYVEFVGGGWFSSELLENDRGLGRGTYVGLAMGPT
jgi:hypothetical protein